jgi:hypothetical protein
MSAMHSTQPQHGGAGETRGRFSRKLVWSLVVVLALLHHDFWFWNDRTLVLGFLPIGLAYHMAFSICAGLLWLLAVNFAWPSTVEAWAQGDDSDGGPPRTQGTVAPISPAPVGERRLVEEGVRP